MRRVSVLILGAALLASACSEDDKSSTNTGGGLTGTVEHLIYEDAPVAGIAVGSTSGASDASDADGSFTLAGVEAPYDIVAAVPVIAGTGVIITGVVDGTAASPELGAVPAGWNNPNPAKILSGADDAPRGFAQDGADVEGTVSNADAAGEDICVAVSDGQRSVRIENVNPTTGTYSSLTYTWQTAPSHAVDVAALQQTGGGNFLFGRTNSLVLSRNSTSTANIALSSVAGTVGNVSVSLSPPGGLTLSSVTWKSIVVIDGLVLTAASLSGTSGTLPLAPVPGATQIVVVSASLMDGVDYVGSYNGEWPGVTDGGNLNISVPAPPTVLTPADGASGVSPSSPQAEVQPVATAQQTIVTLYATELYGDIGQNWLLVVPNDAGLFDLPIVPAVGAELFPSSDYSISSISILEGSTVTPANILIWVNGLYDPGYDVSIALDGAKQMVSGPSNTFSTASQ